MLLVFPTAALVCGLGFEVAALCRSTFRWEHHSTSWSLQGVREEKVFLTRFGALRYWKVKQLWLGDFGENYLLPGFVTLKVTASATSSFSPPCSAEIPAGKHGVRCLFTISCQIFFYGAASGYFLRIILLKSLGTFRSQTGTPRSPGFQRCLPVSAHCRAERRSEGRQSDSPARAGVWFFYMLQCHR